MNNTSLVFRLAMAFILLQIGGCADPNIRERWYKPPTADDGRGATVPPPPPPKRVVDDRATRLELIGPLTVSPRSVPPGGGLVMSVPYTVLTTNAGTAVKITETHALVIDNEPVELRRQELVRMQGTYHATAKVTLPSTLPQGSYTLVTTISDGKTSKTSKTTFVVN